MQWRGSIVTKKWYVLAVQPHRERFVEQQLLAIGRKVACPRFIKSVRHARQVSTIAAPLFPGYLFVELGEPNFDWRRVNSTLGAIGLIKSKNRPQPLSCEFVINFIHTLGADGIVEFHEHLNIGDRIQAVGGPFDRLEGEIVDMSGVDRVKILMDAVNRKIVTNLPRTAVISAA